VDGATEAGARGDAARKGNIIMKRQPPQGTTTVRLSRSLHQRVALLAEREHVSLHQWVVEAIAAYVGAMQRADEAEAQAKAQGEKP
jgi:predicted DNA-binding protein